MLKSSEPQRAKEEKEIFAGFNLLHNEENKEENHRDAMVFFFMPICYFLIAPLGVSHTPSGSPWQGPRRD